MNIVFPELNHSTITAAITSYNSVTSQPIAALPAPDLATACQLVKSGQADAMIAGIDYSSRDVILACREHFGMGHYLPANQSQPISYTTFSGLAVMHREDTTYLLADMAACKHPTKDQLLEIVYQTYHSAKAILSDFPRLALLSFSTLGSGGKDDSITNAQFVTDALQGSPILIDGELQLDAAINPRIGQKKSPHSPVAGQANVLIAPDLNAGNILYKAFEQLAGFTVAGPILQGFEFPVSDLSRGSTVEDVILTIESIIKLATTHQS